MSSFSSRWDLTLLVKNHTCSFHSTTGERSVKGKDTALRTISMNFLENRRTRTTDVLVIPLKQPWQVTELGDVRHDEQRQERHVDDERHHQVRCDGQLLVSDCVNAVPCQLITQLLEDEVHRH